LCFYPCRVRLPYVAILLTLRTVCFLLPRDLLSKDCPPYFMIAEASCFRLCFARSSPGPFTIRLTYFDLLFIGGLSVILNISVPLSGVLPPQGPRFHFHWTSNTCVLILPVEGLVTRAFFPYFLVHILLSLILLHYLCCSGAVHTPALSSQ